MQGELQHSAGEPIKTKREPLIASQVCDDGLCLEDYQFTGPQNCNGTLLCFLYISLNPSVTLNGHAPEKVKF